MSGLSFESSGEFDPRPEPFRPINNPNEEIPDPRNEPFRPPYPDRLPDESYEKVVEGLASGEQGRDAIEYVGTTEIRDFERSGLIANEIIADHLRETLPPSHTEGVSGINYRPEHPLFTANPGALGFYRGGEITIGPVERSQWPEGLGVLQVSPGEGVLWTITHEVGHDVYQQYVEASPAMSGTWEALHQVSFLTNATEGRGFVTTYSATDVQEDFSESYMAYVHDPERLKFYNPEKYEFMRDYVFSGREYPSESEHVDLYTVWDTRTANTLKAAGEESSRQGTKTLNLDTMDTLRGSDAQEKTASIECPWPGHEKEFELAFRFYQSWYASPYTTEDVDQLVRASTSVAQVRECYNALLSRINEADRDAQFVRNMALMTAGNAGPSDRASWDGRLAAISEGMAVARPQLDMILAKFPGLPPPKPYFPPIIG